MIWVLAVAFWSAVFLAVGYAVGWLAWQLAVHGHSAWELRPWRRRDGPPGPS